MADDDTLPVCERCGRAQSAKPPGEHVWLTARVPVRAHVVRMGFSVRAQHGTAPALCVDCHRAVIRQAVFALRVDELREDASRAQADDDSLTL